MATPSSGSISWSQIQAETGGAYSMSNFNAVTGRGYSASNYYNYPSVAFVNITNSTAGTSITNITVNGVQVAGAVFPIVAGDGASASTTQTGASRTIVVSYTNVSNDSVQVTDTASNFTCILATTTSRTFNGQVVTAGGTVDVTMFDGSC